MQQALPIIYCPNLKCRTANREGEPLCQRCGASLPQRYLWVLGTDSAAYPEGSTLLDRYLFRGPQVVIDTQPGIPLASSFDVTDEVLPYLKLFPFRLHLPQVYSLLTIESATGPLPLVLLEGAPLAPFDFDKTKASHPLNCQQAFGAELFLEAWQQSLPLRQVNWLWQMAQLWTPLTQETVASSLLNPQLLRVEGPLLRLLSLDLDVGGSPALADLGRFWEKWCLPYTDRWRPRFSELCDRIIGGQIATIDPLLDEIEGWLTAVRTSSHVQIDMATRTDSGPTREHNEDACYPPHGTVMHNVKEGLVIVCDGVGGHAGGEVASSIAITVLTDHLQNLPIPQITPEGMMAELETAISFANDLISQQNDRENRHDRDRMGTTVVMALAQDHDLYIANLGDSRAYLITTHGCYQLTTDDDIATREVRLGYLPHREAMRQPGAGSLIQALGMVPSSMLRPAAQRLLIDSDCVVLLCSDGVSDFERVETLWRKDLLPLLSGSIDLAGAAKQLIDQANRLNGHDNSTISLLHLRLKQGANTTFKVADTGQLLPKTQILRSASPAHSSVNPPSKRSQQLRLLPWLLGGVALFSSVGVVLGVLFQQQQGTESPQPTLSIAPPPASAPTPLAVDDSTHWQVKGSEDANPTLPSSATSVPALVLRVDPSLASDSLGVLPKGAVLKIMDTSTQRDRVRWLQVKVCQIPGNVILPKPQAEASQPLAIASKSPNEPFNTRLHLKLGQTGYIQAMFLEGRVDPVKVNDPNPYLGLKNCGDTPSTPLLTSPSVSPNNP